MNLILAPGLLEQIVDHAKQAYPNEGCGLLVGRQEAARFIPVTNISGSESEFEMEPSELIAGLRGLRDTGEQLKAIYHSHPKGPARLSRRDIERAYYPEAAHLVVSLADPDHPRTAAFRIAGGEALEVEVHVIV